MSIINDLYDAEIGWNQPSAEFSKDFDTVLNSEEILSNRLSGENLKIFTEFAEASNNMMHIHSLEKFRIGFRLGAQLMIDILIPSAKCIF